MWSRAGVGGWLHAAVVVLHRLDDAGLVDVSRVVLDAAHVRAKKGAKDTGPWTGDLADVRSWANELDRL